MEHVLVVMTSVVLVVVVVVLELVLVVQVAMAPYQQLNDWRQIWQ